MNKINTVLKNIFRRRSALPLIKHTIKKLLRHFPSQASIQSKRDAKSRRTALLEKNKGKVCRVPFLRFDVWRDGRVPVCCTDWMQGDVIIGNVFKQDLNDIWNSRVAKRIRTSVTDGTFSHCTEKCPLLAAGNLPLREELNDDEREYIENPTQDLRQPPQFIKLVNDDSCNLSCPTCRHQVFIESHERSARIAEANMRVVYPMLKHAKVLDVLGNGEALASKATMQLLGALDANIHKDLTIDLLTNGSHFNASAWERLKNIHPLRIHLNVSTDGATKETYEKLRRGGKWETFNQNMAFISELRQKDLLFKLTMNFTIQTGNYKELPRFGDLARVYHADRVLLLRLIRWPHMSNQEFCEADIFSTRHALHQDFIKTISAIQDPIIEWGPLSVFRKEIE